jgi:hypothetical protein
MANRRVDFDDIREDPIEAKFNGVWYKLPADIPIGVLAALETAQASGEAEGNEFGVLREQITKLFQVHQPELTAPPCGMRELFEIIPRLYWNADEAKPTRTTSRSGSKKSTSSPRRKSTRSRS